MHCQVDIDLLVLLGRAVTMLLCYLNTRLVPIHCTGSRLGSYLKATRAGGLKEKILVLLLKFFLLLHLSWLREGTGWLDERAICNPMQAATATLPGFPLVYYLCNSLDTDLWDPGGRQTVPSHPFYSMCIYLAF